MRYLIFSILFFLFSLYSNAQARIYSNEFLSVGAGARAPSMANSVLSSVSGSESGYWNPAGLQSMSQNYEIGLMHSEYFAGIAKYDFLSAAMKNDDSSAFAFTVLRFGVDDIPNTLELVDIYGNIDYSRIKKFSVADYAFLISYGKKTKIEGLDLGASLKLIYRKQGSFATAYGFGFDIGAIYQKKSWKIGATLRDATSTFNAWIFNTDELTDVFNQTGNEIPENGLEIALPKLLMGIGKDFKLGKNFGILSEIGADFTFDGKRNVVLTSKYFSADPHIGLEADFKKIIFLRAGLGNFAKIPDFDKEVLTFQPNIGLGLKLWNFTLDYALTDIGDKSIALYSNVFSLRYCFSDFKKK